MFTTKRLGYLVASFTDQALFAISNFAINLLLARWLSENDYAVFSIAFVLYTFGLIVFNAFTVEPMMVFGSSRYKEQLSHYLGFLKKRHWSFFWPPIIGIIGIVGLSYASWPVIKVVGCFAIASGPLLYLWMLRRSCHLWRCPRISAEAGFVYIVNILLVITCLWRFELISATTGVLALMFGAVVSSAFLMMRLRTVSSPPKFESLNQVSTPALNKFDERSTIKEHIRYGRWAVVANVLSWIPGNLYILVIPIFFYDEMAGELRAVLNVLLPILQFQAAISPIILPSLVRRASTPGYLKTVFRLSLFMAFPGLVWMVVLGFWGDWVMNLLYAGKYEAPSSLLILFCGGVVLSGLIMVTAASLRAIERPDAVMKGYLGATIACLLVGLPLTKTYGLSGVAWGMIASGLLNLLILSYQICSKSQAGGTVSEAS